MKKVWGIFWSLISLSGIYTLWAVWQLPSESKNAFLMGMSKSKLALCAGIALLILISVIGAITSFLSKENFFTSGKFAGTVSYFLAFLLILGRIFLMPPVGKTSLERSLLERLNPVIFWAFAFVCLSFLVLLIQKWKDFLYSQTNHVSAWIWGGLMFVLMSGSFVLAVRTGVGLDPISGTFYRQGVSLLEGHLVVPLLFVYLITPLFMIIEHKQKQTHNIPAIVTAILIWAAAVWFWQSAEFEGRSYFAPALRPPNYNYYPASDAENYDLLAQSILIGNGFRNGMTVVRPLYAAFLALLHAFFGNDYIQITNAQISVLALIPAIIFLIANHLRYPAAGLAAAAWAIWREIYSIRLTPLVQVSNSRLLMSDLPTFLMISLVILFIIKWYKFEKEPLHALLCGGMIGTAMLLRTQCFVLIPAMLLVFLCSPKNASKKWLSILVSLLGLAIVFCPWTVWGKLHPNTTANAEVSEGEYLQQLYRSAAGETNKNSDLWQVISSYPSEIFRAVSAHFLNNEISSVLILPMRLTKPEEADQLFFESDLFWYRENARETIQANPVLIGIYLLIISLGIAGAVRKNGFAGMIPLVIHLVYNLGNAFAMTSGFRFILPSDWIILLYFALGAVSVFEFFDNLFLFEFRPSETEKQIPATATETAEVHNHRNVPAFCSAVFLLAVIGAILPLCETVIPQKFTAKTQAQLEVEWIQSSEGSAIDLSQYRGEDIVFLEGRAFYPRFYKAGEGDSGGSSSAKRGLETDRIVWMFHDQRVHVLNCPLTKEQVQSMADSKFPDPMDVLVVGIQREDYIEVLEMRRLDSLI